MIDVETLQRLQMENSVLELYESEHLIDPRWQFEDGYGRLSNAIGPVFPSAEAHSEQELLAIRGQARLTVAGNCYAAGVLTNLTNYVIGTGFTYTAMPRRNGPALPEGLLAAVQQVLDEFQDDACWDEWERELFRRSRRDGEFFLEFFHVGRGRVEIRAVEPEHVAEPAEPSLLRPNPIPGRHEHSPFGHGSSWSYGIQTPADDVQSVLGYCVLRGSDSRPEFVHAARVQHCKVNVDRNIKRGLSDFYPVLSELEGARKLLRNTREGAAIQAAIAFIRQFPPGTRKDTAQTLTTGQTDYHRPHYGSFFGLHNRPVHHYDPGTILHIPAGMTYLAGPLGQQNSANFMLALQGALRAIAVRWSMPEAMISGDASNANYASSLVAEGPFVKNVEAAQRFYCRRFSETLRRVLEIAATAGRFRRYDIDADQLHRLIDLQVEPPRVAVRDRREETDIRRELHEHRLLSRRTWSALEELDFDAEQQNLEQESSGRQRS